MFDIILNLNAHLNDFITVLGPYFYLLLFLIIFCETGFLFGIFLPGDSLLFSLGVAAAVTNIDVHIVIITVILGAIVGDSCNYITGRIIGEKIFSEDSRFFKKKYLDKTHFFFDKYGAKTLILARFIAFVRTFAPFVAGASKMNYAKFVLLGAISACFWAISITYISFFFSDNSFVKHNLSLIIISAICLAIVYNVGKVIIKKTKKKILIMDFISAILNIVLHLDQYLSSYISILGNWSYLLLFAIIFCETGLVVTPFLPGDSLLFAVGLTSAATTLNVHIAAITIFFAAILGDSCNYLLGRFIGSKIFKPDAKILKTSHLDKAQTFFNKHGAIAIILARFMPIIRTFMPFTAGMSRMSYPKFVALGILGAFIWVYSLTYTAFFFSDNAFVKNNFGLFIIGIIVVSLLPAAISITKALIIHLKTKNTNH